MALNSALGTVWRPPNAPRAPYFATLLEPVTGSTHAQPHLRSLLSLVRFPPDPSVKIVTLVSSHSDLGPNVSTVWNIWPAGMVSCSETKPRQYSVLLFGSPLHRLYSAQNLFDFCIDGCLFSITLGHSQNRAKAKAL